MAVLKTYARVFVDDLDAALGPLEQVYGRPADLRFRFEEAELAAVGDVLLVAGDPAAYRQGIGPLVVDDVDATVSALVERGAEIRSEFTAATGRGAYVHHDGVTVEYLQWDDAILERVLGPR
ncbi:glyoxalase/bleomycin resistance/dioxygenase family protein [Pseudonocardia sp. HH130630-07]|uniref:glyoxalase/bleomycin resistance/dioxygenase family protein n=1 Tax=Pseudonocardia sp. HH130630-07 TaxID=1690815 RepID=UPI0008150198|nr:glyoxalase/bleomycin resistance/dioxygenase family protein [Pseudonocardia sp. HH130630-07]ANY10460.1 hypothetical protein AFB00_27615 [Pseudonocardia sp. HH130630-07]